MLLHLRPAAVMTLALTLLVGGAYPLVITGIASLGFPAQASGSLIRGPGGRVVGSRLIAQGFSRPEYLHPRPSAAGDGYDPTQSGGSNYGPLDPRLATRIAAAANALGPESGGATLPADAVTASASGLDPDVSPENAHLQSARIARARGTTRDRVDALIASMTAERTLGFLGEPRVNVTAVNLALDRDLPRK